MASLLLSLNRGFLLFLTIVSLIVAQAQTASAQETYTMDEIVNSGQRFFGSTSGGLATAVEKVFQSYGLPNGYVLGEEGSGALIGGLTYGEGSLYTKNAGDHRTFWQGPSIGWDFGGQGSRVMMLVYNLDDIQNLYGRFVGVAGSAYLFAGVGFQRAKTQPGTARPNKDRRRRTPWRQCRLSEIDAVADLESILILCFGAHSPIGTRTIQFASFASI